ncbi:MAG TPA: DinB family protein [Chitinophagaceae bacterium]
MDKELIKAKIASAFDNFKNAIQQHSDINGKRADGGWSVGEIANHIIKGTKVNLSTTKQTERSHDKYADEIKNLFLDYNRKFPSAPFLQPDSKQYSIGEVFTSLDESRNDILKMIENDDLTETCVDVELPVWGNLTKYEWLVLFENHIIRHTRQVTFM